MYKLKTAPQVRTQKLNVAFVLFRCNSWKLQHHNDKWRWMWWRVYACVLCFHATRGNNLTVHDERLDLHLCWLFKGEYWAASVKTQLWGVNLLSL